MHEEGDVAGRGGGAQARRARSGTRRDDRQGESDEQQREAYRPELGERLDVEAVGVERAGQRLRPLHRPGAAEGAAAGAEPRMGADHVPGDAPVARPLRADELAQQAVAAELWQRRDERTEEHREEAECERKRVWQVGAATCARLGAREEGGDCSGGGHGRTERSAAPGGVAGELGDGGQVGPGADGDDGRRRQCEAKRRPGQSESARVQCDDCEEAGRRSEHAAAARGDEQDCQERRERGRSRSANERGATVRGEAEPQGKGDRRERREPVRVPERP